MTVGTFFECRACGKTFQIESRFMKHKCKQMEREEEFKTPIGQAAWLYYQKWLKGQRKAVPSASTFLRSRYYTSFVKFAAFAKNVKLADVDVFMKMMRERGIMPQFWTNDEMYSLYLEYLDRNVPPIKAAEITVKTLFKISEAAGCKVEDVFDILHPAETLQFIRERKLSPWLLLRSKRFKEMLLTLDEEQRDLFEKLIRPHYWIFKFQQNPQAVTTMKVFVEELNI